MGSTTIYYVPNATDNDKYVFDGIYVYKTIRSLNGLNGKRRYKKRRGKFVRFFRRIGKGLKKVGKGVVRVVKKVIPIANTVLTFIPGIGWAAKAALTAVEIGINTAGRIKKLKRKKQNEKSRSNQLRLSNQSTYRNSKRIETYRADKYVANYELIETKTSKPVKKTKLKSAKNDVRPLIQAILKEEQKSINNVLSLLKQDKNNLPNAIAIQNLTKEQMRVGLQGI